MFAFKNPDPNHSKRPQSATGFNFYLVPMTAP
jgi:hypothetical protein